MYIDFYSTWKVKTSLPDMRLKHLYVPMMVLNLLFVTNGVNIIS